jgi:hypothetical protein
LTYKSTAVGVLALFSEKRFLPSDFEISEILVSLEIKPFQSDEEQLKDLMAMVGYSSSTK